MLFFGQLDAKRGWVQQLHLGALRNNNTRLLKRLGADKGFDSIGDWPQAKPLAAFLDRLDSENALPKTIIYNNNPADNYVFASLIGNFQDGSVPGKIQFGAALVVFGSKGGNGMAVERAVQPGPAFALCGHGDGLPLVHVLPAP